MKRLLIALALAGCGRGGALDGACASDGDCGAGLHCIRGTGVCARFNTPLDDLGLRADLALSDGTHD